MPAKKNGHAKRTTGTTPKRKRPRRIKLRPGQPDAHSVFDDKKAKKICTLVRRGHSYERSASVCGISRGALHEWRAKGSQDPDGPFGQFFERLTQARDVAIVALVEKLRRNPDWKAAWKLLKNMDPREFSERFISEISGPGGAPIPVNSTSHYTVKVTCSSPMPDFPIMKPAPTDGNGNGQTWRN
jgi:hypothetical protein